MRKTISLILGALAMTVATPAVAQVRGDEPVAVPRTIKQGIDFVYVDPDMSKVAKRYQRPQNWLQRLLSFDFGSSRRQRTAPNPLFFQFAQGLQHVEEREPSSAVRRARRA